MKKIIPVLFVFTFLFSCEKKNETTDDNSIVCCTALCISTIGTYSFIHQTTQQEVGKIETYAGIFQFDGVFKITQRNTSEILYEKTFTANNSFNYYLDQNKLQSYEGSTVLVTITVTSSPQYQDFSGNYDLNVTKNTVCCTTCSSSADHKTLTLTPRN
ncbi:MAG TPA: hypothetical protein DHW82_13530 [Spirochaetia bacterium]|nr:MAG: hypothetical protein A2Y41_09180 [Spirochaetes bacterium GWB1_36_13]HCL58010.1 hypothetical protein [Spirochaetia bacterium]